MIGNQGMQSATRDPALSQGPNASSVRKWGEGREAGLTVDTRLAGEGEFLALIAVIHVPEPDTNVLEIV